MLGRHVRSVPNLLRNETDTGSELLDSQQKRVNVAAGRQFVGGAFARKQGPRPSHAPAQEGAAVIALAIPIMVVALPARALRSFHLENGIHDFQCVINERTT